MGIYLMVTVDLVCDACGKTICKLYTSKRDLPMYADAKVICSGCVAEGVEYPKGSTGKDINDYVDSLGPDTSNDWNREKRC